MNGRVSVRGRGGRTPSENLIYLGGLDIKWNGPVLASFISDTVPYWWRRCSLVLQCFVENCREREIYVVVGSVLTRMSLDVSVECYFLSIMKHSPPTILLTNELLIIEYCFLSPLCCCLQLLFVALLSPFSLVWPKLLECPVSMCLTPP